MNEVAEKLNEDVAIALKEWAKNGSHFPNNIADDIIEMVIDKAAATIDEMSEVCGEGSLRKDSIIKLLYRLTWLTK